MRIAFLADIHSNLPALEAVRADLQVTTPDVVYVGGDQINRCPWLNEVMELINAEGWPAISGNHELLVRHLSKAEHNQVFEDRRRFADLWWTVANLKPQHLAEIEALPAERLIEVEGAPTILLLHGLKENPFEGLTPDMSDEQIKMKIANIDEPVIVTAHTHRPLDRVIGNQQVFNPGSVGMPYNGDPRAHYGLLDWDGVRWQPTFRRIAYDLSVVREAFDRLGLFRAYGPLGPLYWQTIETGDPWVSDFQVWLRDQPPIVREDYENAVALYMSVHGPGKWAFVSA
jgi:putative phosphoesterase